MKTIPFPTTSAHNLALLDDESLMALITEKQDQKALEVLYQRHRPVLRGVIGRVVGVDADVDDVLQDVFIQVWKQSATFSAKKGQLLGWLITIARRRALDRVRQLTSYQKATNRYEESIKPEIGHAEDSTVDREVRHNELTELFDHLIADLPKEQGVAVQLTFFSGLSQREIAARLSLPLGTVKTRIELAVRKLGRSNLCREAA
ncbi:sigma-70 family RNA polymerase sigma factor [Verrucomicrobium sp. BvORR034]|uniref:RNA polymerase sigma factor n=1 Tax=Verrucomicrobium sp. BvORR034 TaxID=1396418 RepID=UPI000679B347|nr:sigma-70 family RNA polymerase sigma factor [Verrucomicrobium sp. BvORR034]